VGRLKVLFIDDQEAGVLDALRWVENDAVCECHLVPFTNFEEALESHQPHIAVVDRWSGSPPTGSDEGRAILEAIWDKRFCPTIIYSAFGVDDFDSPHKDHPFVKVVQKGADPTAFRTAFLELKLQAQALYDTEKHIREQFALALKVVAPYAAKAHQPGTAEYSEAVLRFGRRRVAALMDEKTSGGALAVWEQYIHPPLNTSCLLGDILLKKGENKDDPASFRLILSASCDMVLERPKIDKILVANFVTVVEAAEKISDMCHLPKEKLLKYMSTLVLTPGFYGRYIPFPPLESKIPLMMADLKKLDLIPFADVVPGAGQKFEQVASLDSPFRELISWAYMQNACRPGMPDRDCAPWCQEIKKACG
jgi:hypothetical protein